MALNADSLKLSLVLVILTQAISSIMSPDSGLPTTCPDESCAAAVPGGAGLASDIPLPHTALVNCSYLPDEFMDCKSPEDLKGNDTRKEELGYGCTKFGGQKYDEVEKTRVWCTVLPGIECYGNRTFLVDGAPCIRYTGHYFVTTLIYSVLLGFIGLDRFCLGHTGTAVGKLLTLGGVGIWWIVDIVLLVTGGLMPEDGSNWQPYV